MTLGRKIREARKRVGMTQTELAGSQISRNMLSMIENDKADPSYRTLLYLADRLTLPVCFFFDEEADLAQSLRNAHMPQIYDKLRMKDYHACLSLCAVLRGQENDELYFIKAQCYFHIGLQYCFHFSFGNACDALLEAQSNAHHTAIGTEYMETVIQFLIHWMSEFCQSGNPHPKTPSLPVEPNATQYYLWLLPLIGTLPDALVEEMLLEDIPLFSAAREHLRARIALRNGCYREALALLQNALSETDVPLLRFLLLSDMETIYTQIKDYENEYMISLEHRDMIRKLHIEKRKLDFLFPSHS